MEVKKTHFLEFQNEEHDRFETEFDELLTQADPVKLKVEAEHAAFKPLLADEHEALDFIRKSAFTEQLDAADIARDKPTSGYFKVVNGMLNHFDPAISEAAHRLKVINDNFTGITGLSNKKQSSATDSMLAQLKGPAAADITLLGLTAWVNEIESKNNAFKALDSAQLDEKDGRTRLRMKDVRILTDAAYNAIVTKINALIIVEGEANYSSFVNKLNLLIDSYNNTIAQRKGIAAAKAAKAAPKA